MKRSLAVGGLLLSVGIGACAETSPPTSRPPLAPQRTVGTEAAPPPLKSADLLAQQPSEVQAAVNQHEQDGAWAVFKSENLQLYPFGEGPEPLIDCEPLKSTDIQLQAGETITDVAMGDSERWQAVPAASGDPRQPTPHIAIKPQAPGIKTNLTIYTTHHIYHLALRSRPGHGIEQVTFYYPEELLAAMREADRKASENKSDTDAKGEDIVAATLRTIDPAALNFSYTISGPKVPWRPIRAFDDRTHVYIEMPHQMNTSDAPALLIDSAGGNQVVNYRVRGNYYVIDRLFERAVLLAGVGRAQDRVVVAYTGQSR